VQFCREKIKLRAVGVVVIEAWVVNLGRDTMRHEWNGPIRHLVLIVPTVPYPTEASIHRSRCTRVRPAKTEDFEVFPVPVWKREI
jgi:hypothetical protein